MIPLLEGKDIIAQGQSGSGKTTAFVIAALQKVDPNLKKPQVLIIVPFKELLLPIRDLIVKLGEGLKYSAGVLFGGLHVFSEEETSNGHQIIVGTPGRIAEDLARGAINNEFLKLLVMDEADELLEKSRREPMRIIIKHIPRRTQIGLFFSMMGLECLELTKSFMNDPVVILRQNQEILNEGITQYYYHVEKEEERIDALVDYLENVEKKCVIYCNNQESLKELRLCDKLDKFRCGIAEDKIVDLSTSLEKFQAGIYRTLITTSERLRGFNMLDLPLLINFDTPLKIDDYIKRVGRIARFGKKSVVITFVTSMAFVNSLNRDWESKITELPFDPNEGFD